jgi:hypothetical protein
MNCELEVSNCAVGLSLPLRECTGVGSRMGTTLGHWPGQMASLYRGMMGVLPSGVWLSRGNFNKGCTKELNRG